MSFKKDVDLYAQWYTDVTLVANSKEANWTGKPITVKGYHVVMPGGSTDADVTFPGVSASRTETDPGTYPVKIEGAKVNETVDAEGELLVTKIQDGRLVGAVTHVLVDKPECGYGIFADRMYTHCRENTHILQKAS